jgi:O-antigen/teichoic acid export membrane protein
MALTNVLFPGLSRIQSDPARVKRAYLAVLALAGLVLFPICAGMGIAAQEIVRVVLGPQWDLAAGLVPWFALAIVLSLMSRFAELTCEAIAELNKTAALQGAYLVLLAGLLFAVRNGELWMFAAALAAGEFVRHVSYQILMSRLLGLQIREYWQVYGPALFTAAVVAVAIYAGRSAATTLNIGVLAALTVEVVVGAVGLLIGIRLNPVRSIKRLLRVRIDAATGSRRMRGLPGVVEWLALGRRS